MIKHFFYMALTLIVAIAAVVFAFKLLAGLIEVAVVGVALALAAMLFFHFARKASVARHGTPSGMQKY